MRSDHETPISRRSLSFRFVAKHLGLTSPNHFHLVIERKRHFSSLTLDKVARFLKLPARERQYLKLLFLWDHTTSSDEKRALTSRLQMLRQQLGTVDSSEKALPVVGNKLAWYIKMGAIVFEGKTRPELVALVGAACRFSVSEVEIYQALEVLEQAKMVDFGSGTAQFEGGAIVTKWDFDRSEIKEHHRANLNLASHSIAWPIDQRFLSSVTLPCNAALYETFVEDVRLLCRSLLEKTNSTVTDARDVTKVVTLQVSLFPYFEFKTVREPFTA